MSISSSHKWKLSEINVNKKETGSRRSPSRYNGKVLSLESYPHDKFKKKTWWPSYKHRVILDIISLLIDYVELVINHISAFCCVSFPFKVTVQTVLDVIRRLSSFLYDVCIHFFVVIHLKVSYFYFFTVAVFLSFARSQIHNYYRRLVDVMWKNIHTFIFSFFLLNSHTVSYVCWKSSDSMLYVFFTTFFSLNIHAWFSFCFNIFLFVKINEHWPTKIK